MNSPKSLQTRLLRVGELAQKTGKTNRAIRFYEELGLLMPTHRTKGGFRKYHPDAVTRIHWIDRLQELGFSLNEIRDFLETFRGEEHGPAAMDQLRSFYTDKLAETRQTIARLQGLESELESSLSYLQACHTCAPKTLRTACHTCSEPHNPSEEAPALVAAVASPL
ncbi:MAG: MerR family transcriptional regulator [Myxococcota bacterium]